MAVNPDPEIGDGAAVSHLSDFSERPHLTLVTPDNSASLIHAARGEHLPSHIYLLEPTSCAELPQARQRYRDEQQLADSILESGQLQAGAIAYLDYEHCQAYLAELNEWYKTTVAIGDPGKREGDLGIVPDDNEMYRLVIFGHRRRIAVKIASVKKAQMDGVEPHPDYLPFAARVYTNIGFFEAKLMQLTENKREDVAGPEEALEMTRYYEVGKERGEFSTQEECAERLGISTYELQQAIRFTRLPQSVQDIAFDDISFYPTAAALARLVDYCDESDLFKVATKAKKEKWSATKAKSEVYQIVAVRELPEEVQAMVIEDILPKDVAIELSRARVLVDPNKLAEMAREAWAKHWDVADMKSRVNTIINNAKMVGFEWGETDEYNEAYEAEMAKQAERQHAIRTLTDAVQTLGHYTTLVERGIAGSMDPVLPAEELEEAFKSTTSSLRRLREHKESQPDLSAAADGLMSEITQFLGYEPQDEPRELVPAQETSLL